MILVVALGLGAVIFVHELGHFLVAKACGVKCEKFMIGFDIGGYKLSRKWGETEYGIGILPLGGYVKMLGQDDDPGPHRRTTQEIRNRRQQSRRRRSPRPQRRDAISSTAAATSPRACRSGWRSFRPASIMNVIFAFIFAVVAYGLGVKYMPSHRLGDRARFAGLAGRASNRATRS